MKAFTKVALIVAGVTTAAGIALFCIGSVLHHGKPFLMSINNGLHFYEDYEIVEQEKTVIDSFKNVSIDVSAAKIKFVENDTDEFAVAYRVETPSGQVTCDVKDNTLTFRDTEKSSFMISTGFNFSFKDKDLYVTVYYPQGTEFGKIDLDTSAGGIIMEDELNADKLIIDSSAGKATLKNISAAVNINMSAGSLTCEDCNFGTCVLDMSAGDVTMTNCTVDGGSVDMSAGSFKAKGFILTKSLNLDMSAGDVEIEFVDGQKIGYDFDLSAGSAKINGEKRGSEYQDKNGCDVVLTVDASAGSIDIINH
ncbi:MAG: DUF4097 family beta strand repeat protein [Clostridiales bacterium]|nr:DUF4097 family beta strand repeat protein [Clostridiales bacterium]